MVDSRLLTYSQFFHFGPLLPSWKCNRSGLVSIICGIDSSKFLVEIKAENINIVIANALSGNKYSAVVCLRFFKISSKTGRVKARDFPEEVGVVRMTSWFCFSAFLTSICDENSVETEQDSHTWWEYNFEKPIPERHSLTTNERSDGMSTEFSGLLGIISLQRGQQHQHQWVHVGQITS